MDALNAWVVSVVRYSAGIMKWRKDEMKEMDRKTRKIICIRELMLIGSTVQGRRGAWDD